MSASCCQEKHNVRILLSVGLVAALVVHACTLVTAQRAVPWVENMLVEKYADNYPTGGVNFDHAKSTDRPINSMPVNSSARDEIKKQQPSTCVNCKKPTCVNCKKPATPTPAVQPAITPPVAAGTPIAKPTVPKYSLSIFVLHDDPQSQQLLNWFNSDPKLKQLASSCNTQFYATGNALYKARYSAIVPPTAFPAVLFTDPNGGHVHAVNRSNLPSSPKQLMSDLSAAYKLQKEVVKSSAPAQVTPTQSSEAKASLPASAAPSTPAAESDLWSRLRPGGDNCRDGDCGGIFGPRDPPDAMQGLLRLIARPSETMFLIIIVMAVVVVVVFYVKRGR